MLQSAPSVSATRVPPDPPEWADYTTDTSSITVRLPPVESAAYYDIYYDDATQITVGSKRVSAPATTADISCDGQNDGRALSISIDYTDADGVTSARSIAVSMLCAGVPEPPEAPTLVLGNRDIISV